MPFYLPRRHRRRLLLPPGLVALAGLLLVGCLALRPWQERLTRPTVIDFTMPVRHGRSMIDNVFEPKELTKCNDWYDTYFDGSRSGDARHALGIIRQAAAMQAFPQRDQRLQVQLGRRATYAELVFLLDTMDRFNIKKYVLDINHGPTVFYAFTVTPLAHRRSPILLPY
jgi:hypothetical protein